EKGRADHNVGGNLEQVNQRRHHDEAAAHAHDGGEKADSGTYRQDGNDADEELRGAEAHLERQSMNPVVLTGPPKCDSLPLARAPNGAKALHQHQAAHHAEETYVEQGNNEVELSQPAQIGKDIDTDGRTDDAAGKQHETELHIERTALEMR